MTNTDGLATIVVRLPFTDTVIGSIDGTKSTSQKKQQVYEDKQLHTKSLTNDEENNELK